MSQDKGIPAYSLFGQDVGLVEPRFCHVERIGDRWTLHSGQIEEHSHPHLHQMTFWLAGSGHYVADEARWDVGTSSFCWMPAGVVHGFCVSPGSEAIVLSMSDDFAREQLGGLTGLGGVRLFRDGAVLSFPDEQANWLRGLFERMEQEYATTRPGQVESIGALARLALTEMHRGREGGAQPDDTGIEPSLLVRFMALVETRVGQRPNIDALVNQLGTTPYLLNRACRAGLGMRASDVVRARHIQEAKRLLLFTALTVNEIGQVLGYPDPAHFARSFRTVTGMSPSSWRQARISMETKPEAEEMRAARWEVVEAASSREEAASV